MIYWSAHGRSVGALAINWAVNGFVLVLLFTITLGLLVKPAIPFQALVLTGIFAVAVHAAVIGFYSRSVKWRSGKTIGDSDGIKLLEYTVSIVSWVLQIVLWWYDALDAAAVFLFIPTYFVTSLLVFHEAFRLLGGLGKNKKTWISYYISTV